MGLTSVKYLPSIFRGISQEGIHQTAYVGATSNGKTEDTCSEGAGCAPFGLPELAAERLCSAAGLPRREGKPLGTRHIVLLPHRIL